MSTATISWELWFNNALTSKMSNLMLNQKSKFCNICLLIIILSALIWINIRISGGTSQPKILHICNDLSYANPNRLGVADAAGTGPLAFKFVRIKNLIEKVNGDRPLYYLFENVKSMTLTDTELISTAMIRDPELVNSKDYGPQRRQRYFWYELLSREPPSPDDAPTLQDLFDPDCGRPSWCCCLFFLRKKAKCLKTFTKAYTKHHTNSQNRYSNLTKK